MLQESYGSAFLSTGQRLGGGPEVSALAQVPPEAFAGAIGERTLKVSAD